MKFSDDLLKSVSAILEAKPRVSFDGDKATVHSKNGTPMKSFNKKDLGNSYRKHADNFLSQNYKKLNAESVIVEELEEAKQLELPGMEKKKPQQLELPLGDKKKDKKDMKESEDLNTDNAAKATMHDCAKHVRHEEFGLGQCISTMHTLEEDEDGNGFVTHYDVMFKGEDGPFIKEDISVEELEIISEMHHGHPKGKKKKSANEEVEAIDEKKGHKKDKGDMDGDGKDEPDDEEYMDNKDKAIKVAMSKKKSESPIKKVEEEFISVNEAPTYVPGFIGADGKATSKPTKKDYDSNKEYQHMKKKLGDRIPGPPPVKKINKEHIDSISAALQEISKKTMGSYIKKASSDAANKSADAVHQYRDDTDDEKAFKTQDKAAKRLKGIDRAINRLAKESINKEHIDSISAALQEISKKTLGSYAKKAVDDRDYRIGVESGDKHSDKPVDLYHYKDDRKGSDFKVKRDNTDPKLTKRTQGIKLAVKKMQSEDAETVSEISKGLAGNYLKKAMKSSDKQHSKMIAHGLNSSIANSMASGSGAPDKQEKKAAIKYADKEEGKSDKAAVKYGKRQDGIKRAVNTLAKESKITKEHVDSISVALQEISKKTLGNYAKAAIQDRADRHGDKNYDYHYSGGNIGARSSEYHDGDDHKIDNRNDGINKAMNRMSSKKYGKSKPGKPNKLAKDVNEMEEGIADAIKSKLHPSRVERNAASRRQDQEAAAKSAVKKAVASTVAKSLEKKEIKETEQEVQHTEVETPMTNMERLAGFISSQTKVQSADGTSMMGVKKDLEEKKKMSKAEFKDMMAGKGKKDKGDMDGDGKDEPDSKEYMDNKDNAIKKSMGKKGKKDDMEEAIDQKSSDPEKTIGHNCATHVEHAEFGAGECIPGMHTLEETSEGEGIVTHYDVMFKNEDGHFVKEDVSVEDLTIVKEMHHGHKKKK